ncbi:MAG TPA: SIMPL domain-containing protein [Pyrinomonadaceae bacterium]|nr:SIMPL domain-containing protein [Pyrinomonadaceae bacterium]
MKRTLLITGVVALVLTATTILHAKEITVRGKLQKTVESGGWLIAASDAKYLILNAKNFQSNAWFKESTNVEAVGETKDVMTTYMEGTPFEAKSMQPVEQKADDNRRVTRVMVAGDSIVQAQPDTAIISIAVVTQNRTAISAQQDNAAKTDAVVRALKAAAGTGAEVKTSGYSLQPQRVYKEGQPPTISGYEARNNVTVTLSDLTKVGSVIDAAAQAGANDFSNIAFTLRQDRQARDRALSEATREAVSKAQVIASALGGRVVRIVEVQEEGFQQRPPVPVYQTESFMAKRADVSTPIEVGSLDISSRVQVIAEVETNM